MPCSAGSLLVVIQGNKVLVLFHHFVSIIFIFHSFVISFLLIAISLFCCSSLQLFEIVILILICLIRNAINLP